METTLSIPELLVQILSELDLRTLLLSQRVSKNWRDTIVRAPELQRALFFEPIAASSADELTAGRRRNPLLEAAFPPFFRENARDSNDGGNSMDALIVYGVEDPFSFMDAGAGRRDAFLRRDASWRRMLVQQPAARKIGCIEQRGQIEGMFYSATLSEPQGLRMGTLYDIVYQFIGTPKALRGYDGFGVYWRVPEHDPKVGGWSWKDGSYEVAMEKFENDVAVVVLRNVAEDRPPAWCSKRGKASLSKKYLPHDWQSNKVDLKFVNEQDWFG
ncbi:hypothetical protein DL769_001061 [Monosporascus sp. CRB-8-3]|nr:hypothetical protein DL769_001061 [Monosporascus sp. CRB-8-3]